MSDERLRLCRIGAMPIRMRCVILNKPPVDEPTVTLPTHVLTLVKRHKGALRSRQPMEGTPGKIVVLEVVVGIQKGEVPKPVTLHERAPLRRIVRVNVVMLPE